MLRSGTKFYVILRTYFAAINSRQHEKHCDDMQVQAQPNSARKQGHGMGDRQTIMNEP